MTTIEATPEVRNTPENLLLGAKALFSDTLYGNPLFRTIADARMARRYRSQLATAGLATCQPYVSTMQNGRIIMGVEVSVDAFDGINRYSRIRFAETDCGQLIGAPSLARDIAEIVGDDSPEVIERNMKLLHGVWNVGYTAMCVELGGDIDAINSSFRRNARSGLFEVRPPYDPYIPEQY